MTQIKKLPTPKDFDNIEIKFQEGDKLLGSGFICKDGGAIGLLRCPQCSNENYSPAVITGICAICGFDANLCSIEK
ncbi:hypothetical protein GW933_01700 [Candidatus Falkowbacteria bacterium]|uniref:Uncharacterized protein n=1 Tax=Candidatus Buchananbacteria bacterium CG10_big_fil_rev_8_21_14_0_10_33_19 TaxID=1974525 RepID=A0A2H0W3T3_9BACT|nr:hypothetical protein [Candidatus Falkowbacteria bacterium]PIS05964.1 MAG: hypothetical protein COT80_04320 [Candidatus Buchananbacteria bacterium CG10_big_fil_rev_8_21_14_0_10_33_19]